MPTGRFAPTPSGPLHVGNLRTALLAWLVARAAGSAFRLRIEDLDRERTRREHEAGQLADLRALGIEWDGTPVRQSERVDIYREALDELTAAGRTYPCWCSRADIRAAARAPHGPDPEAGCPRGCAELDRVGRELRERETGRPPSLRYLSQGEQVGYTDRLHGERSDAIDDFVLWRWDDTPAYNLAVVVDDAAQGVEEIVRGDDLLDTTGRHVALQRCLGLPFPAYAHVPLLLGPDGERLAKRHGGATLAERAEAGEGAAATLSWMAHGLGLSEPGEPVTAQDLIARFDPSKIPAEPAIVPAPAARH